MRLSPTFLVSLSVFCLLVAVQAGGDSQPLPPFHLRCDGNIVGIAEEKTKTAGSSKEFLFVTDSTEPDLSWSVSHTGRAAAVSASRVLVATDPSLTHVIWDSGTSGRRVDRGKETSAVYAGKPLQSGHLYYWKVAWRDDRGQWSEWSKETGHFLTGILDPRGWEDAKWIAAPSSIITAPRISKRFPLVGSEVGMALFYISGIGFSRTYVNGIDLNNQTDPPIALSPGWTNYQKRVPYSVYLVTDIVALSTEVRVDIVLGMGWRNSTVYPPKDPLPHPDSVTRVARAVLHIMFLNGSTFDVYTDETWTVDQTQFAYDSIYNGETFDSSISANSTLRLSAVVTEGPAGKMYLARIPPMAEYGSENPVKIYRLSSDSSKQIVDFGNNSAGVCQINVTDLKAGSIITLHHAEVPLHPPYGPQNGSLYYENLRLAKQTDTYISNGSLSLYQPTFTYHGFRYVEVSGYPRDLTASDIKKKLIGSNLQPNSQFNTSNPLLNQIQENCVRSQRSNLMSVPTDCCQRDERLGWMGDAGLSSDSMALNFETISFHVNFVQLIVDELTNGTLSDVTPFFRYGFRPADPSWGAALPQILWVIYHYYGHLNTVKEYFPMLVQYLDFVTASVQESGMGKLYGYYGDWVPPPPYPEVNVSFASGFSYLNNLRQAQEIAEAINDTANASRYSQLFQEQSENFNKAFLSNNQYLNKLQVTYVLPLYLGIVSNDSESQMVNDFLNQLQGSDNGHITAGIIGTKFILPLLTRLKRQDLAMEIVQQTDYPSWGFMIHNEYEPATALWELWNSHNGSAGMDSRNHHMFSSVSGWMMTDMVGLRPISSGFRDIQFHPASALDLSQALVSLQYPKPVHLSWKRNGGLQCGKAPESKSSQRPGLLESDGLQLSCGEGNIFKVVFASFGTPRGQCGFYREGPCHASISRKSVEKLCLGKSECLIPSDTDFWDDPCPNIESRWLTVAVQCSGRDGSIDYIYKSLAAEVGVPVGNSGTVLLPAYGKSQLLVKEAGEVMWERGKMTSRAVAGIRGWWWDYREDSLVLELSSGKYEFTVTGGMPEERKWVESDAAVSVRCEDGKVVSTIEWASYGDGSLKWVEQEAEFVAGSCHYGSSKHAIERACLGKQKCVIPAVPTFFGNSNCDREIQEHRLSLAYTCNKRP